MPLVRNLYIFPCKRKEKAFEKSLFQSPTLYIMEVKCSRDYKITRVFSHVQTVLLCAGYSIVQCQPTGGKARLMEGCLSGRKQNY
ncbi:small ribosomal subunit protein eS27-like [Castor canadensis]|uniref:Small ribosomal subunit protein eS27-like n=1 Tax=Castor canadensis TaxID=51338 RepID=A0AC58KXB6_CASCN